MQVRRTPRTNVSSGQSSFARTGGEIDATPVTQAIQNVATTLDAERRGRQGFELQQRLLAESNARQTQLEQMRLDPDVDPFSFAQSSSDIFEEQTTNVLSEYESFDLDLVRDFQAGQEALNNQLNQTALTYQTQALNARAIDEGSKLIDEVSRAAEQDPDSIVEVMALARDSIDLAPDLTEPDRIRLREAIDANRVVAADALVLANPEYVIQQLDLDGRYRQKREQQAREASSPSGTIVGDPSLRIMNYEARAVGIDVVPDDVQTLGQASDFARRVNAAGADSSAMGVYQIVGSTMRLYGPKVFGADWKDQNYDFESQDALARAIFEDHNGSAQRLRNQWVSLTASEAERIRVLPWEEARNLIAKKESGADLPALLTPAAVSDAIVAFDPGASTGATEYTQVAEGLPSAEEVGADYSPEEVVPEHPALALLTGPERLRAIRASYQATQQQRSNDKAEMDLRISNIKTQIETNNGQISGAIPTLEELLPIYGEVNAPQVLAELEGLQQRAGFMQDWVTSSTAEIDAELERLRPSQDDPALAVKMQIYEQAVEARDRILESRSSDPAAYAIQTNPAIQEAINSGNSALFYSLQRAEQARLGIPAGQRNPWPQEYIEAEKENYVRQSVTQRADWMRRHLTGATREEFSNFVNEFRGTPAYDDALMAQLLYINNPAGFNRLLPMMLQGSAVIQDDPARRPPSEQILVQFQGELLGGIRQVSPDLSRSIQNTATSIYVARGGDPQTPDTNLYRESLREALGGVNGNTNTGWADFGKNGVNDLTILPTGVTATQFEDWIYSVNNNTLQGLATNGPMQYATGERVSATDVAQEGVMVMLAPGVYTVKFRQRNGVTEYAFGANGSPIRLRISPEDVRPSRSRRRVTPRVFNDRNMR